MGEFFPPLLPALLLSWCIWWRKGLQEVGGDLPSAVSNFPDKPLLRWLAVSDGLAGALQPDTGILALASPLWGLRHVTKCL